MMARETLVTTGQLAAATLLISILSGFVVAYQFEPATPFAATVAIETILPWGWFWRGLHFWSSQAFFLMLVWHTWVKAADIGPRPSMALKRHWSLVSLTLPMGIFALFSGYVIRYDGTGQAAGTIAEHLMLSIPLVGGVIDRLLLGIANDGMNRLYAVHILMAVLCWALGTWYHTGRVRLPAGVFLLALSLLVLSSLMVRAPLDLLSSDMHLIKGPWFFLGIQEMLRGMDPFLAGVAFPLIPMATAALWPWSRVRWPLAMVLLLWAGIYLAASVMGVVR